MTVHVVKGSGGLHRRAFTVDDVSRMVKVGILREDDRVELVDGELIEMSPAKFSHDRIKMFVARSFERAVDRSTYVAIECTLRLDEMTLVSPDIMLCPDAAVTESSEGYAVVPGPAIHLIVEIAQSSLWYDRRRKAGLYARSGVPEYWVIDTNKRVTWRYLGPTAKGYDREKKMTADTVLTPLAPELSEVAIALSDAR